MAITWEPTIIPKCVSEHKIDFVCVATDDEEVGKLNHILTVTAKNVTIETGPQKLAVLDFIWNKYLGMRQKNDGVAAVIGSLEADAKVDLEGRSLP